MESCCDIIDQLPSEAYKSLFGDKVNDFVRLRSLRSKVKAKIVKFDKQLQNQISVPVVQSKPISDLHRAPSTVSTVKNVPETANDEEMCPDLINFLKLNEEERDSWGSSNDWNRKSKMCFEFYVLDNKT